MGIYSRTRKADNGEAINRGGFQMKERETHHRLTLQDLVITALMIALTFGMTFINVRLPIAANGGRPRPAGRRRRRRRAPAAVRGA